jgi:hypothetical protein
MDRTVREHISFLEDRIQQLNFKMMESRQNQEQINQIESELRAASLALSYYRKALELEQNLAKPSSSS